MKKCNLGPAGLLIEKGWTQKYFALNKYGENVLSKDADACCWCAAGAINAIYDGDMRVTMYRKFEQSNQIPKGCIVDWNDEKTRTHEQVLDAFEKAGI